MVDPTLPIQFRNIMADDYPFIMQTWGRIFRTNYPNNLIPDTIYYQHQNNLINKLLSSSTTLVAYIDDKPEAICGYLVASVNGIDNLTCHWGHVKAIYRRLGILKSLLEQFDYQSKQIICTHHFSLLNTIKDKYGIIYDPTTLEVIING